MYMPYDQLPDPTDKFELHEEIATGINARVFRATELANDRVVAIKIQTYDREHQTDIEEEYRIYRDYSSHPNLLEFLGTYRKNSDDGGADKIWFVLEYCEGGTVVEMVNRLMKMEKKMQEEHIAFILREVARGAVELNRNHFIHRDIRGSNVLLTASGQIKLCDFGLTREVDSTMGKRGTCIGSPCWMAPEVVTAQHSRSREVYDSRSDVWALGILAIEIADGKPPFFDMHPARALFQIVRNPPPTLMRPTNWSQTFNDFITECLEKNFENRPVMMELIEHPFLTELFDNELTMQQEIKKLVEVVASSTYERPEEISVDRGFIRKFDKEPEKMYTEDLAAVDSPVDEIILDHLSNRTRKGQSYSFLGDILLSLNSNDLPLEYEDSFHAKYKFKSRSENAPHIFSVADIAYQDMMHHKEPQHVIFSGESYSGKSTNASLFINHLCYLGSGNKGATDRVQRSIKAIHALINAGTPLNNDSTRCCMQYYLTFGTTGKMSGAVFVMYMLEKLRVSSTDMNQHNFHIFYYFYDFINEKGKLNDYHLDENRSHRYLRTPTEPQAENKLKYHRDDPKGNVDRFKEFESILEDLDFSKKNLETMRKIYAAILNIGNIRFKQTEKKTADIEDLDVVSKIADLLRIDEKKFQWSLTNYCKVKGGIAERKQYTTEEARDARDALAATIYHRLVDWIVNKINMNMSFPRAVFGDINSVVVYDMFGFECFHRNGMEQLMINTINEQMQYHYNQRIFANEMMEQEADGIPTIPLNFYDNKTTLDNLLTKPDGLFYLIDQATRDYADQDMILDKLTERKSQFVKKHSATEISIAHYTGKIIYDSRAFTDINRDFVPPEMIESLRTSLDESIVLMLTNQLTKAGNLTMAFENIEHKKTEKKRRAYHLNTLSIGSVSQSNNLRTLSANFRYTCLELLKTLSQGSGFGTHFVRCIRADLEYQPRNFHPDMVQQQMKALGVIDTIIARQKGYSCRISFQEFLDRYQFLAFDFDETVDITKENCRLLLIRLKMEGWAIGKSKVFLRYYNDEFLSRLYEVQVKKIIKVQSMMRALITRRKTKPNNATLRASIRRLPKGQAADDAAIKIQKAFRGFRARQKYGPLMNEKTGQIDETTALFLKTYVRKWREKSLYQVLLYYRAAKFQDLVNMSQQVHIYNQHIVSVLNKIGRAISLDKIDPRQNPSHLGPRPLATKKLPFRLDEIPFYDTTYMCDPVNVIARSTGTSAKLLTNDDEEEPWDAPLQKNPSLTSHLMTYNAYRKEQSCQTNWDKMHESDVVYNQNYSRDPNAIKSSQTMNYRTANDFQKNNNYGSQTTDSSSHPDNNYMNHYSGIRSTQNAYNRFGSSIGSSQTKHHQFQESQQFGNNRNNFTSTGSYYHQGSSRRNSLKSYPAPPPPPPPMNMLRNNDASRINSNRNQNSNRNDFRLSDPVREMELIGRRTSMDINDDNNDEPPFNFKAMLRKTNYPRPENNNMEYNMSSTSNNDNNSRSEFQPKLRQTGRKLDEDRQNSSANNYNNNQAYSSTSFSSSSTSKASSSMKRKQYESGAMSSTSNSGRYIEEEIAPGVTLTGIAIDI